MKKIALLLVLMLTVSTFIGCNNTDKTDTSESDSENLAVGGAANTEFHESFILFSSFLTDDESLVGNEKTIEWTNYTYQLSGKYDPYICNLYEYIKYFDIPRENLEKVYYSTSLYYLYDYDFDILYSGDVDKVYEYYLISSEDPGHEYYYKKATEQSIKWDIAVTYLGSEKYNNWLSETGKNDKTFTSWSIPEAVYAFDIPRAALEKIINYYIEYESDAKIFEDYADGSQKQVSGFGFYVFDYDLDKIYNEKDEMIKLINSGIEPYLVDESLRK